MNGVAHQQPFPRSLSTREQEWIDWILPVDRPGYCTTRDSIGSMTVIGEGRRGKGELILGPAGSTVDFSAPLAPVLAYGAIETNFGTISISLREKLDDQISVEMVSHRCDEIPHEFEESRRWTYSTWNPGNACPQCGNVLREVPMHSVKENPERFDLAMCAQDRRIWVYEASTSVNRLIPVTNYYNELMLHKNIRDPKIALDNKRFFLDLQKYSDADLTYAFLTYNKLRTKVHLNGAVAPDKKEHRGILNKLRSAFIRT